jgi:hypothetical protein
MPERRESRLRREFADLYPGVPPDQWRGVQEMIDLVAAGRLRSGRCSGDFLAGRPLDARHFEFRGGFTRPPGRHTRLMDPSR